ncbi:TM2 domain-containing protein [Pseudomonas sp. WS 5096]|uniref:TM2 domain-containing protein n=1 Tax=Pseudomonas cremoris TaxID=2724178 RepID=A0ABR6THU1_9PSED|nr:TM2 domain-containing protein [Pseudomonas cremoris]MBC2385301.1 TM2 domain-containing protein [Pseudomonas cremoris]
MNRIAAVAVSMVLASATLLQGCTTRLAEGQERELSIYEQKGLLVQEKSVAAAGLLGVLPGAGYFYTGHYVLGITTLPLYPFLGPLWMPFDAAASAKSRNYYATKMEVDRSKAQALRELDHKLEDKQITYEQHIREQRTIEAKYSAY